MTSLTILTRGVGAECLSAHGDVRREMRNCATELVEEPLLTTIITVSGVAHKHYIKVGFVNKTNVFDYYFLSESLKKRVTHRTMTGRSIVFS